MQMNSVAAKELVGKGVRILTSLGMFDPTCHLSARTSDGFVITPTFDETTPAPIAMSGASILDVDRGGPTEGSPPTSKWHAQIYEQRPDVGAAAFVVPPVAMALAAAKVHLRPVTHAEAWLVEHIGVPIDPIDFLQSDQLRLGEVETISPVRGLGVWVFASSIEQLLTVSHAYEYLARMNQLIGPLTSAPIQVSPDSIASIQADRATPETRASVKPVDYLYSFDPGLGSEPPELEPLDIANIKELVARSCRMLAAEETLVGFYEHVSHRVPGRAEFVMSPAKNFAQINGSDVVTIGLDDDASWLDGPHAPAPFRRFHRDIFVARPDVSAIVHTHEMFGRAFTAAHRQLVPSTYIAAGVPEKPPSTGQPSMVFRAEDRQQALQALASGAVLQLSTHGSEYVGATIQDATVVAIHRERAFRSYHIALPFGSALPLPPDVLRHLASTGPSKGTWWKHHLARQHLIRSRPTEGAFP